MDEDDHDEPSQNGMLNGYSHDDVSTDQTAASKPRVRLSYEDYKNMANLMVMYIRQEEEKRGDGMLFVAMLYKPTFTVLPWE